MDFEKYAGIHHPETECENISRKRKKEEQRHRDMDAVDLFRLKHEV